MHIFKIEEMSLNSFDDIREFYNSLPSQLIFFGTGRYTEENNESKYMLLCFNESVYAIKELLIEGIYLYDKIIQLDKTIILGEQFVSQIHNGNLVYTDFETDLEIEIKIYEHYNEIKLLINPLNKIDLLYSLHFNWEDEPAMVSFEVRKYPSLESVIKMDKLMKKLDARISNIGNK